VSFGARRSAASFTPCRRRTPFGPCTRRSIAASLFRRPPAYGGTRSETVLGKALKGIPRDRYFLSTKVGKYTNPEKYARTRSITRRCASANRLKKAPLGSVLIISTSFTSTTLSTKARQHAEWALDEGLATLHALKKEGRIGAVSFGIYPMDLWQRISATTTLMPR